jgi:hypothetical protein
VRPTIQVLACINTKLSLPRAYIQVVPTKVEVNQNYLGDRAFSTYQMVASSQIMMVRIDCCMLVCCLRSRFVVCVQCSCLHDCGGFRYRPF